MAKLKAGDRVVCRLKERAIINPYRADYDEVKVFDIIANNSNGYYLYVQPYVFIKDAVKIDNLFLKSLNLHKKYLNDSVVYIAENFVYRIESQMDGCVCDNCQEFSYKALPNQEDGGFICFLCRQDPYR